MGSSGNTPSPRARAPIPRWVQIVGDDHPRACTGRRLVHLRLARAFPREGGPAGGPIVLDPYAADPIARPDRARALRQGVLAIDCSWNALSRRGHLASRAPNGSPRRRLPFLIAGNPQHYGRLGELNTVEALGAAVYLLGRPEEAIRLLAGFAGGPAFLEMNRDRLDRFAEAKDAPSVRELERALYGG